MRQIIADDTLWMKLMTVLDHRFDSRIPNSYYANQIRVNRKSPSNAILAQKERILLKYLKI